MVMAFRTLEQAKSGVSHLMRYRAERTDWQSATSEANGEYFHCSCKYKPRQVSEGEPTEAFELRLIKVYLDDLTMAFRSGS